MPSQELLADFRRDEGLRLKAYPDPLSPLGKALQLPLSKRPYGWERLSGNPWTLGYGHTGVDVSPGDVWTKAQADAALYKDACHAEALCDKYIPWWRKLDPVRADVMVNLMFNMGWDDLRTPEHEGLSGFVRTLPKIKAGDYEGAAEGMAASLWARQTKTRAERLIAMMRTGERA